LFQPSKLVLTDDHDGKRAGEPDHGSPQVR
jgi:hypothetical protein